MHLNNRSRTSQQQVAHVFVLILLYAAPALICLHAACMGDTDIWWHLRAGEWVMQHRSVPYSDPFSSFGMGKPWAAYSWMFEVLVVELHNRWDLAGILIYSTTMVLAITLALHHLVRRLSADNLKAMLLVMAAMISMSRLYTPRPWLFTILFVIIELDLLMDARKNGNHRNLLLLPVMFAVWANIHIQFINGLVVLLIAGVEVLLRPWWPESNSKLRPFAVWSFLATCVLATFINPYGWHIYQVAYQLASEPGVLQYVTELQAIPFRALPDYLLLFLALAAAGTLAWSRRPPAFETILLGLAAIISFRSVRDVWFMAIIATAILASQLPGRQEKRDGLSWIVHPLTLVGVGVVLFAGTRVFGLNNSMLHVRLAELLPVRAAQIVKENRYRGALYNDYAWGGYLIWSLREPVIIDGRAALHGDKRIERSIATWNAGPEWSSDPDLSAAGIVIAPLKVPLTQVLRMDTRFKIVYEDEVAAVFVTRPSQNTSMVSLQPTISPTAMLLSKQEVGLNKAELSQTP